MKVLVTSGGTKVRIDAARHLGNDSKGGFGKSIAAKLLARGHHVTQFHAEDSPTPFTMSVDLCNSRGRQPAVELEDLYSFSHRYMKNFKELTFVTFDDYSSGLLDLLTFGDFDAVVLAAAVSDYGVLNPSDKKERTEKQKTIELFDQPKLISKVKSVYSGILVGFKMLTNGTKDEFMAAAEKSIIDNRCDIVLVNNKRGHGIPESLIVVADLPVGNWSTEKHAAQTLVNEIEYLYQKRSSK